MSYNVDTWKTKKLEGLTIPVKSLFKHHREDWHPSRENNDDGSVTFSVMVSSYVSGVIKDGILIVSEISATGEGSGTALDFIIEPALRDSKGTLVASRVWEGGDSIDVISVQDGVLTTRQIEI